MYSVAPFYNFPRQYLFGWSPLSGSITDESIFFVNIILILVNIWGQHGWVTAVEMGAVYTWHQIAPLSPWQTHLQLFQNNSNFENISLCTYYRWKLENWTSQKLENCIAGKKSLFNCLVLRFRRENFQASLQKLFQRWSDGSSSHSEEFARIAIFQEWSSTKVVTFPLNTLRPFYSFTLLKDLDKSYFPKYFNKNLIKSCSLHFMNPFPHRGDSGSITISSDQLKT